MDVEQPDVGLRVLGAPPAGPSRAGRGPGRRDRAGGCGPRGHLPSSDQLTGPTLGSPCCGAMTVARSGGDADRTRTPCACVIRCDAGRPAERDERSATGAHRYPPGVRGRARPGWRPPRRPWSAARASAATVVVEAGRRDAGELPRRRLRRGGRRARRPAGVGRRRPRGQRPRRRDRPARRRAPRWSACSAPAQNPELLDGARRARRHRARHRRRAAHLAGAVARRAQLDGQHRGLPRGDRGRAPLRALLHRPGHRRGQGAAGEGARRRAPAWPGSPRSARRRASAPIVRATDPRPEVAEQVALAGRRVPRRRRRAARRAPTATPGRPPRPTTARAAEIYAEQAADVDIVVTTALIPGRAAPRLLTADDVARDEAGQRRRRHGRRAGRQRRGQRSPTRSWSPSNGVTIIGYTDLAGPAARAGLAALRHQPRQPHEAADARRRTGSSCSTSTTSCSAAMTVSHGGEVTWPPPPVPVSRRARAGRRPPPPRRRGRSDAPRRRRGATALVGGRRRRCCSSRPRSRPPELATNLTVFVLAVVIGYYVIGKVHHALHTPLMSVTNAISGVIVVGALLQIGRHGAVVTVLACVAILLASINIVGGFAVTRRMLAHVHEGARAAMSPETAARRAYIVAALLFIMSLAGLSQARDRPLRRRLRHRRHGDRAGRDRRRWPRRRARRARPSRCSSSRWSSAAGDRAVAGARRRDDRHARADRAAAQLRRSRRGARRAGTATSRSRASARRRRRSPPELLGHPPRRGRASACSSAP